MEEKRERKPMAPRQGGVKRSRRKVCAFCQAKAENVDYKDVNLLKKYILLWIWKILVCWS